MASNPVAQPALYLDTYPTVSSRGGLFAVEFPGLTLMMTPHALIGLIGKGKASMRDWSAMEAAKLSGFMVDESAEIIAFPKPSKARSKGRAR